MLRIAPQVVVRLVKEARAQGPMSSIMASVHSPEDVSFLFCFDDFESRMTKISGNDVIAAEDFDLPVGWQRSKWYI